MRKGGAVAAAAYNAAARQRQNWEELGLSKKLSQLRATSHFWAARESKNLSLSRQTNNLDDGHEKTSGVTSSVVKVKIVFLRARGVKQQRARQAMPAMPQPTKDQAILGWWTAACSLFFLMYRFFCYYYPLSHDIALGNTYIDIFAKSI